MPPGGQAPLCTPVDSAQPSHQVGYCLHSTNNKPSHTARMWECWNQSAWGQSRATSGIRQDIPTGPEPELCPGQHRLMPALPLPLGSSNRESLIPPRGLVLRVTRGVLKWREEHCTQKPRCLLSRQLVPTPAQRVPDRGSGCAGDEAVSARGPAAGQGNPTRPSPEELCYATP